MSRKTVTILSISILMVAGVAISAQKSSLRHVAMVPGANLTGTVAITALNRSPLISSLKRGGQRKPSSRSLAAHQARLQAATGLTFQDINSAVFSCDLNTYGFKGVTPRAKLSKLNGIIAIQLAKPITLTKIKKAIKLEYGSEQLAGIANVTIAGHPALLIKAPSPAKPDIYAAVTPEGRAVLIAFNPSAISGALQRSISKRIISEPPILSAMRAGLPGNAQIKAAAMVPSAVRDFIKQQTGLMEKDMMANPGQAAVTAVIRLFSNIRNVSIGVSITNDVRLTLVGDLGSSQAALQAATLLQTILMPMMKAALQQQDGNGKINLDRQMRFSSDKRMLHIDIYIPREQLLPSRATGARRATRRTAR